MSSICPLPWMGFSNDPNGTVRPCCISREHVTDTEGKPFHVQTDSVKDIFNSEYMNNLRQQFLNGEKPEGCSTCWKDEDNGYTSKRQSYKQIAKDYKLLEDDFDYKSTPEYPIDYQIILTNSCNLKCRSCHSSHSTSWTKELSTLPDEVKEVIDIWPYDLPHGQSGNKKGKFFTEMDEWIPNVKRIEVVGGEPFYSPVWEKVWGTMIEKQYSKNITLHMSTNATIYNEDLLVKLATNFDRLGIGLSIDGLGNTYEYLRKGGIWSEVEENLSKFHLLKEKYGDKIDFNYNHTTSWINAFNLPDFFEWTNKNTPLFSKWINIVHFPQHMAMYMLPKQAKDYLVKKWGDYDFGIHQSETDALVKFMYSQQPSDDEIRKNYKKFTILDKYRSESTIDLMDEICPILKDYL